MTAQPTASTTTPETAPAPEKPAPRTRRRPGLERVLATADRLFYENGIHATGVDLIAAEANVSKATMYTYFATKDDLVAEYLRRRAERWHQHVEQRLPTVDGGPRERVLTVYDLLGQWFATPEFRGCPFNNAVAECASDSAAHHVNLDHRAWVRALFERLLTEAGAVRPAAAAPQLALLYDGAMTGAQADPATDWAGAARTAAAAVVDTATRDAVG